MTINLYKTDIEIAYSSRVASNLRHASIGQFSCLNCKLGKQLNYIAFQLISHNVLYHGNVFTNEKTIYKTAFNKHIAIVSIVY